MEDGSECRWARVLVYEPPDRVVFRDGIASPGGWPLYLQRFADRLKE